MFKLPEFIKKPSVALSTSVAFASTVATNAHADLPAAAASAISTAGASVADAEAAVWPFIGAAIAAMVVIRKVKAFSSKI